MLPLSRPHWLRMSSRTGAVLALAGTSMLLLLVHVLAVREMRSTGLPAASALPALQHRVAVLTEQAEVSELQAALGGGTQEEAVRRFVLPATTDTDRLLATLDTLFEVLRARKDLSAVSAVTLLPLRFEANVTEEGAATLLRFFDTAGMLTVSDALTPEETALLLRLTEQENPAAVTALERFLATDLLRYAHSPRPFQDQLLAAFSSDEFRQTLVRLT